MRATPPPHHGPDRMRGPKPAELFVGFVLGTGIAVIVVELLMIFGRSR